MKKVVQDLTSGGIDWQREKWQSGLGSKFIHQGEKNAVKYADEVIVLSKGVQDYFKETYGRKTHFIPNGVNRPQTREANLITDEEKLVTYPRTDSQFVTEDMRKTVESLVLALDGQTVDVSCVINNSKVTDHHAILPTMQGAKCDKEKLSETKQKILSLIIWKLVQVVQPPFIYEDVLVTVCCQGQNFTAKYIPFMVQLCGKPEQEITDELAGAIFRNPVTQQWETSDEYLSGNVREKLATAETFAANHAEYQINVDYLKRVQPKDLDASEIEVRLGANWVKPEYITQFMKEVFKTPNYYAGMERAVALYDYEMSLQAIGEELGLNPIKVRKLLITAGVYESDVAEKVQDTFEECRETQDYKTSILSTANTLQLSKASVTSYLPYKKGVYYPGTEKEKISVGAERQRRYRAMKRWRTDLTEENFWGVVVAYAGVKFKTYSGLPFTYEIKKGRNGEYTKELWIDRREKSKSLAWSSVLLALQNIKKVGEVVDRPKALGDIRGVTYIYGMFYRFGLIDVPDEVKEKMKRSFSESS